MKSKTYAGAALELGTASDRIRARRDQRDGAKLAAYEAAYGTATYGIRERVSTLQASLEQRVRKTELAAERVGTEANVSLYKLSAAIENTIREELRAARAALIEETRAGRA